MHIFPVDQKLNERLVRVLAIIAISVGIGARLLHFGVMPPGLNQDEASIGYEAWSLLHHGIDRNGVSYPIHLISWGDGQNALYAYLSMPFIAFGLSPLTVRLPMLLAALASLWLVWVIADRLFDRKAAWGATAIVALCPWHIMLTRWGLESNLLPFVFLCGFACWVIARDAQRKPAWISAACALFGLSLYSYGTAYLAVPIFVLAALILELRAGTLTRTQAAIAFVVFAVTALPIALLVAVNTFGWPSLQVAGITIPRMPVTPRFQSQLAGGIVRHIPQLWHVLSTQSDGTPYNVTDPYGVLYSSVFFALAIGLAGGTIFLAMRRRWPASRMLLAVWLIAALPIGFVQTPNINRINLLLLNLVFCAGLAVSVIDTRIRGTLLATLSVLLVLFGFFTRDYFTTQRDKLAAAFFYGLVPALQYAQSRAAPNDMLCVTQRVNAPYIFALFAERTDPQEYLNTVRFTNANIRFRQVIAFGRYTFGLERCALDDTAVVIARDGEIVPETFGERGTFGSFKVYTKR